MPAAFTGIVGIKPSFGRVPAHPSSPFGTLAHLGPMTRCVGDAALMLSVMAGRDTRDWHIGWSPELELDLLDGDLRGARIGVWSEPPHGSVEPAVAAAFAQALRVLEDLGAELAAMPPVTRDVFEIFRVHWSVGAAQRLRAVPAERRGEVEAGLREVAASGAAIDLDTFSDAVLARARFGAEMETLLDREFDLVVSPATSLTAFEAGVEVPAGSGLARWTEWAGFSYPLNLTQQPALVVPAGLDADGLPIGLQIIGRKGADLEVLGAGLAFERATAVVGL